MSLVSVSLGGFIPPLVGADCLQRKSVQTSQLSADGLVDQTVLLYASEAAELGTDDEQAEERSAAAACVFQLNVNRR